MAERQKLPEMPPEPPPELAAILQHLSVDIGLDYLTLLDLRSLDPPPALGANLLMIIGTARSEKHLHVSADRFCRYLRTSHKLRPYADGLLGRNEIKLKMRRKNRRAKLMANAGVISPENVDDGIRTGWVCVHAGQIEPAEGAQKEVRPIEGFVGFGSETNKVTIVVQMLTEEKREELDLESLWNTFLSRNIRRQSYRHEGEGEFEAALEAGTAHPIEPGSSDRTLEHDITDWDSGNAKMEEAKAG
ncbi:ATPase synthesis protein 25 mitochondrial [Venturia effusa]|uniref:ATPase synthesis protein 25 n=1 Tax=Venturia effusa TaxID=50376 RepID=A0A517KVT9_9PEZI|nr:ATPase synthesis protein 25 mitochondrial [Venturia effusa]